MIVKWTKNKKNGHIEQKQSNGNGMEQKKIDQIKQHKNFLGLVENDSIGELNLNQWWSMATHTHQTTVFYHFILQDFWPTTTTTKNHLISLHSLSLSLMVYI